MDYNQLLNGSVEVHYKSNHYVIHSHIQKATSRQCKNVKSYKLKQKSGRCGRNIMSSNMRNDPVWPVSDNLIGPVLSKLLEHGFEVEDMS